MNDLDFYITRHLHPSQGDFFALPTQPVYEVEWESPWDEPATEPRDEHRPTFPRVIPPVRRDKSMAHDGGPGVQDHSRIKHLLREWL